MGTGLGSEGARAVRAPVNVSGSSHRPLAPTSASPLHLRVLSLVGATLSARSAVRPRGLDPALLRGPGPIGIVQDDRRPRPAAAVPGWNTRTSGSLSSRFSRSYPCSHHSARRCSAGAAARRRDDVARPSSFGRGGPGPAAAPLRNRRSSSPLSLVGRNAPTAPGPSVLRAGGALGSVTAPMPDPQPAGPLGRWRRPRGHRPRTGPRQPRAPATPPSGMASRIPPPGSARPRRCAGCPRATG